MLIISYHARKVNPQSGNRTHIVFYKTYASVKIFTCVNKYVSTLRTSPSYQQADY